MMQKKSPLGLASQYPDLYSPDLLFPIARGEARKAWFAGGDLPFSGEDIWNAYELSWLDTHGKPHIAVVEMRIPAESECMVESKSLKLYLNSFAGTEFACAKDVKQCIEKDLSALTGAAVCVDIFTTENPKFTNVRQLPGFCIDSISATCDQRSVDPELLKLQVNADSVQEELYSNLLRSHCPVTNQPDTGSILISYAGAQIEPSSLLRYIVSYRNHQAYHEDCVERIFMDIMERCRPEKLSVYARYLRRGGVDINPFRSNFEKRAKNARLWRQ